MKQIKSNGMATASFILALCGVLSLGLTSLLGFVLGIISYIEIKRTGEMGEGFAITAIVIGSFAVLFWGLAILGAMLG